MSRVFRQQYTRPIPPDAERVTHKGVPAVRFKGSDGKYVVAPLTRNGDRCRISSPLWYGQYTDADGKTQRVALCENKAAAEQTLAELVKKAEQTKAFGLTDPFGAHRKKSLAEHLADWEQSLQADIVMGNAKPKHVRETVRNARRVIEGCRFVLPGDLSGSAVEAFLAGLRQQGRPVGDLDPAKEWYTRVELAAILRTKPAAVTSLMKRHRLAAEGNGKRRRFPKTTAESLHQLHAQGRSIKTINLYLASVKQFAAWLVRDKRVGDNPLADLEGGNVELDRRHDRQTLSEQQLSTILQAALSSMRTFRGMTGVDRHYVYLVAMTTGFRAGELAVLPPEWFNLDEEPPTVVLPATMTKNKKPVRQPIPGEVAQALHVYLAGKSPGHPVWPGTWSQTAAEMLRIDLDAAGVPYTVEGPAGLLFADFHSLRHSFISLLDRSGASLKVAMQLARHSDPKLTMARYGRAQLHDLGQAVDQLPCLTGVERTEGRPAKATGTAGAYTPLTQIPDGRTCLPMVGDGGNSGDSGAAAGPKSLKPKVFEA